MKILQVYIFKEAFKYLILCSISLTAVFSIFDFLDRIDVILRNDASFFQILQYFLLKIPGFFHQILPITMIISCIFTIGLLSKNSELTAMRASGLKVMWLCRPILILAIFVSCFSLILSEYIVPYGNKKSREIYNLDIQKEDKTGIYSKGNIWLRSKNNFISADLFDSRNNRLINTTQISLNSNFEIEQRSTAEYTKYLGPELSWSMKNVNTYNIDKDGQILNQKFISLPLTITETPSDFYNTDPDTNAMTYKELKAFIKKQSQTGLANLSYDADLYSKLSFPFIIFICTLAIIPLSLKPARTGSMASSFIAGIVLCFLYYLISSLSLAFGRAGFWNPFLAAWMANIILGLVALLLQLSVEEAD